jgi:hypothetical protein
MSVAEAKTLKPIPKIKTPYNPEPKLFETDNEFNEYYHSNKDEMDKMTTYQLNKAFKIKDYHIAKRLINDKKEIVLTREYYKPVQTLYKEMCENSDMEHAKKIVNLEDRVKALENLVNILIEERNERLGLIPQNHY